uniref:Tetratricopeptide repeat protein n=1 Tax=Eiseniibacteriota bacterium TaxID=2212470 RepID=A0A832I389_UNCEI
MRVRAVARAAARRLAPALALAALAAAAGGCAYYNTFYYARKYYFRATAGAPYALDEPGAQNLPNYNKAIDYSKKVIANYPKSKWVDDAYLLWAVALLGKNDPLETINMLGDFTARYPESPVADDARFYLGLAHRRARQYAAAVEAFDAYLERRPKGALAPYALLERSRALVALERPAEAAASAGAILERFPKHALATAARAARAEALFAGGDYEAAREDYRFMGARARDDQQRFDFLLREADCLEAARRHDDALALLDEALAHELEPRLPDTTGGRPLVAPSGPVAERWGRLMTRAGTVHLRAGRLDEALEAYARVIDRYPRSPLAAEAQFRIGYAYETVADDFARAREAYARVREQNAGSAFTPQAQQRLGSLDRLAQFARSGGDSLERQAEAGFLLAEQYLFGLDRPERALEEYARIAERFAGTRHAAKALNAQAWVLRRKLDRPAEADSLWWHVVRNYPATEGQLAARDYLELGGASVPPELIRLPEPKPVAPADTAVLTAPPAVTPPLGGGALFAPHDSAGRAGRGPALPGGMLAPGRRAAGDSLAPARFGAPPFASPRADSGAAAPKPPAGAPGPGARPGAGAPFVPGAPDTAKAPAPGGLAPRDTARVPASPDSVRRRP